MSETTAETVAVEPLIPELGTDRHRGRRWIVVTAAVVVVAAVVLVVTDPFGGSSPSSTGVTDNAYPT
jgi:hypothetical protein